MCLYRLLREGRTHCGPFKSRRITVSIFEFKTDFMRMLRGRASFEPSPCHRLDQIYFLTFVFLVPVARP